MSRTLSGVGVTPRTGVGTARWHVTGERSRSEDGGDPDVECERVDRAFASAERGIESTRARVADWIGEEEAAVFDAHEQFLADPTIREGIEATIEAGGSAERAVETAFSGPIERFEAMEGRVAERADDLRDVRGRLLDALSGGERVDLSTLPEGTVLLAERLTPSDTARLDPERVVGFATSTGGRTSHASIFARSLGIPAVVGVGEALATVEEGETVGIDGRAGEVVVDPNEATSDRLSTTTSEEAIEGRVATTDDREIEVAANVGTSVDLDRAAESGADGVGLLRTEFLFLDRATPPDEEEQLAAYEGALSAFDERVVVRTLDVGADKPVPYLDALEEVNPFLGLRGIRRSLADDRRLFETQLRALLRAGAGRENLAVMVPMVATVEEVEEALAAVDQVASDLEGEGVEYARPELGVMIETPAAVLSAPALAERVAFFSVGTNDLSAYVMAADRENERLAELRSPLQPAVLRAIAESVEAAHDAGAWIGVCGEMAGDPDLAELLVGLGVDELSMSPISVPSVKARVRTIEYEGARALSDRAVAAESVSEVEDVLGLD
ncbi:phosphoenolpyruvate--protein phosphotransferase [Natronorarus salvus]|uniref:phosphoenolpyruvate--protein phosphotransferase n=1 Tax=Natronorarus salvus TaxID=3117733 RepID=UPI002F2614C7